MKTNVSLIVLIVAVFLVGLLSNSYADEEIHPIDVWFEKALDETDGITIKMLEVGEEAYKRWDEELNIQYKKLQKKLGEEDKNLLREAQRAWIKFRDTEFDLNGSLNYQTIGGTLYRIASSSRRRVFVRKRALELKGYNDLLDMHDM